jgi:hypothetical protein
MDGLRINKWGKLGPRCIAGSEMGGACARLVLNLDLFLWVGVAGWLLFQGEILRLKYVIEEKHTGPGRWGPKASQPQCAGLRV